MTVADPVNFAAFWNVKGRRDGLYVCRPNKIK